MDSCNLDIVFEDEDFKRYDWIFSIMSACTDDYLYIYDFVGDKVTFSKNSTRFVNFNEADNISGLNIIKDIVHKDDFAVVYQDLMQLAEGKKALHDMEYRWVDRSGNEVWINCRGVAVKDSQGNVHYLVGRVAEISRKNKIDDVTGLYRESNLKLTLASFIPEKNVYGFLLHIGIDGFKEINEKYGQEFGNVILKNTAECIKKASEGIGRVYRMHGDEMMVLCTGYDKEEENPARDLYRNIRMYVDDSISGNGYHMFHTISGGAVYFEGENIGNNLIEEASFALHKAKLSGKNTCVVYSQEEYNDYVHRLDIQEALCKDVENDFKGFEMYYQPIVNIVEKKILGAEALLRWNSEEFGFMSPGSFVPILEESGLIIPLGRWIIKTALEQCNKWRQSIPEFRMNINLSFVQLKKSDALNDILKVMDELNIDSKNVIFEVTESGELEAGNSMQTLKSFKNRQINLAIDDFGTGYSNLRYIKEMTFDLVKIDQSFIRNIKNNQYDFMVVKQFTELAHMLNLKVCYEGVETKDDLECVLKLNPDYIQGYYFARPVPVITFEKEYLDTSEQPSKKIL